MSGRRMHQSQCLYLFPQSKASHNPVEGIVCLRAKACRLEFNLTKLKRWRKEPGGQEAEEENEMSED